MQIFVLLLATRARHRLGQRQVTCWHNNTAHLGPTCSFVKDWRTIAGEHSRACGLGTTLSVRVTGGPWPVGFSARTRKLYSVLRFKLLNECEVTFASRNEST